jgi:hypothetical protein
MSAAVSDVEGAVSEAEIATVVSDRCVADGEPVEGAPHEGERRHEVERLSD